MPLRCFRALTLLALVLLALSLPALAADYAEGTYTVPFSMEGLGRHNIAHSTATVHVEGEALYVDFTLERVDPRDHAPQYDWMDAGLGRCIPAADDAAFTCSFRRLAVPQLGAVDVTALTSAMSQPYEVEYRLHIDGSAIPAPVPEEPAEAENAETEAPAEQPDPAAETPEPAAPEQPQSTAEPPESAQLSPADVVPERATEPETGGTAPEKAEGAPEAPATAPEAAESAAPEPAAGIPVPATAPTAEASAAAEPPEVTAAAGAAQETAEDAAGSEAPAPETKKPSPLIFLSLILLFALLLAWIRRRSHR